MRRFSVPEMSCGHCKAAIEKAVSRADSAARVAVDLEKRTVEIDSTLDDAALLAAIRAEGYEAVPA